MAEDAVVDPRVQRLELSERTLRRILAMNRRQRRLRGWRRPADHYRRQLAVVTAALAEHGRA